MSPDAPALPRVLAVDDEPLITTMLARVLREDCVVVVEHDGRAALDRLRRDDDFALVLSDLRMPWLDGFQLLAAVRRELPAVAARFAILTGGADPAREAELERLGVPVLYKPFGLADLRALVGCYLAPARPRLRLRPRPLPAPWARAG